MHSPDVLFLDEPTNSLDPQSRLFLWDRIRTLNQQGVTALLTTHNIEEADQLCERVAIMDHGKILVLDTPDELKKTIPGGTRLELRVRIPELVTAGEASSKESTIKTQLLDTLRAMPGVVKVDEAAAEDDQDGQQG